MPPNKQLPILAHLSVDGKWWGTLRLRNPCLIVFLASPHGTTNIREPQVWPPNAALRYSKWRLNKSLSLLVNSQRKYAIDTTEPRYPPEEQIKEILEPRIVPALAIPRWLVGQPQGRGHGKIVLDTVRKLLWQLPIGSDHFYRYTRWKMHPDLPSTYQAPEANFELQRFWDSYRQLLKKQR